MAENEDIDESSSDEEADKKGPTTRVPALDVRFSQKKMRNVFADGKLVENSIDSIRAVRLDPDEAEIYGATWRLETPFPPIEIMRFMPKLRDENTGRPLLDPKTGREMFEDEESWFTLDNRRLCCLQKAAVKLLPDRCLVDAIAECRKERRMREIRKFRTMDNGQSIMVGSVVDGVPFERWHWREAAANPDRGRGQEQKPKGKGGKGKGGSGKGKGKAKGPPDAADGDQGNDNGTTVGGGGKKGGGKGKQGAGKGSSKGGQTGKGKGKQNKGENRGEKGKGKSKGGKQESSASVAG